MCVVEPIDQLNDILTSALPSPPVYSLRDSTVPLESTMLQAERIGNNKHISYIATTNTLFRSSKYFTMSGTGSYRRPSPEQAEYTMTSQYPEHTAMPPHHQDFAEVSLETPRHYIPGQTQTGHPVAPHGADTHLYPTAPFSGFYSPPPASTGPPSGLHYLNATSNHEPIYSQDPQRDQIPHAGRYRTEFHPVGTCENPTTGCSAAGKALFSAIA